MSETAVIAGSGAERLFQDIAGKRVIDTPYGPLRTYVSDDFDPRVTIILRHELGHQLLPHLVNYRASISGLSNLGVERIIALGATGSLRSSLRPGDLVLPDQFLDFTKSRPTTFIETSGAEVAHVDVSNPFCDDLRRITIAAASDLEIPIHPRATYACTEGPRYETAAEIRMFKMLGGDLVGMTMVPEVVLAREKEICYLHVSVVTNMAAGTRSEKISHGDVERVIANNTISVRKLIKRVIGNERITERKCSCRKAE